MAEDSHVATISLVENGIITQQRALETTYQTLLEKFSSDANDRITIQQSIAHSIEGNQAALTRLLTEHNSVFIAHIAAAQAKLKALTITAGVFFVSMLCYVGYDVWSKFN
ncbi:hypothetical protein MA05_07285 [Comamonas aquatica]|uniref:hypothetical protein n=1 Tax=Comamonas aquatica TaxID=225991 RepID=UPI0005EC3B29|nr:hypothetical protein [Comamonas aquatica]ANY61940.1 hypothetical protein MA05_07285 [Comamonas aquatica]